MTKINFVDHSGETRTVDVDNGATVMEAAIRNAVPGIEAECGGACACATCHIYIDDAWAEKVGKPTPMEEDMLDFGYDVRPNSRSAIPRLFRASAFSGSIWTARNRCRAASSVCPNSRNRLPRLLCASK